MLLILLLIHDAVFCCSWMQVSWQLFPMTFAQRLNLHTAEETLCWIYRQPVFCLLINLFTRSWDPRYRSRRSDPTFSVAG